MQRKRSNRRLVRERNEAKLLAAAEAIFAQRGFEGATTAAIARRAGVPKPNLHYYFRTKAALYAAVLDRILAAWLDAMDEIRPEAEPAEALARYIARKMESSRRLPEPSRLWAIELISGARHVQPFLRGKLRRLVKEKSAIIRGWIAAGKMAPVAPEHLLFMIWAMTQTYADFAAQVAAVLGKERLDAGVFEAATQSATEMVLRGLGTVRLPAPRPSLPLKGGGGRHFLARTARVKKSPLPPLRGR
ncbi:MAG TPA: TetR family transcriptional regulator C-terminal domain-containing protein [Stellaceae bacterium]|nr:TetR family transcriptional regulator C-terminal domain-containing protein [Stellaceae bacterium]